MPYYEKRIRSGKLLEVERYFATRNGRLIPRGGNRADTPEDMEKVNQRNSEKRLMRLICTNFSRDGGDLFVTFTHKARLSEREAMREERNLIARLERLRERKGLEPLKRIVVTEEQGRWHHHVIMNGGLTLEELAEVWGERGRFQMSLLDDTYSYEDLAKYLTKQGKAKPREQSCEDATGKNAEPSQATAQTKRKKWARRWHASRNLKQPEVEKKEVKRAPTPGEPKPPKGYRLLPNWFMGCDLFGNLYTYYACVLENGIVGGIRRGGGAKQPTSRRGSGAEAPAGRRAEPSIPAAGKPRRKKQGKGAEPATTEREKQT